MSSGLFIADCAEHARSQAGEHRDVVSAGIVDPDWIPGEIGQVLARSIEGRTKESMITIYKSLGHTAKDLVVGCAAFRALVEGDA